MWRHVPAKHSKSTAVPKSSLPFIKLYSTIQIRMTIASTPPTSRDGLMWPRITFGDFPYNQQLTEGNRYLFSYLFFMCLSSLRWFGHLTNEISTEARWEVVGRRRSNAPEESFLVGAIDRHPQKLAMWPTNDRYFTQFHLIFSPSSLTGVAVSAIAVSIWTGTSPKLKIGAMAKWWSSTAASQVI